MSYTTLIRSTIFIACLALITAGPAWAQNDRGLERIEAHAENRPLKSLKDSAEVSLDRFISPGPPREIPNVRGKGKPDLTKSGSEPDVLLQTSQSTEAAGVTSGFFGTDNNTNGQLLGFLVAPPDTDGAVGPNHFVQMINLLTTIFDKSGNIVQGPFASNAFWSGMGGNCEPHNQGDPIVLYDETADRWLFSQFAFPDSFDSFSQCVAISQTGDPTSGYNRYEFSFTDIGFNDYPKHGIVSDSITLMANIFRQRGPFFNFGGTFLGVMDKAAMYAGNSASLVGFNIGTGEFGFLAGDLDGPGSSPALFATAMSSTNAFDIWQIDIDWGTGNGSASQIASIPISPYDADFCGASREACIPQPDGAPALEAISDRLMHRLQIRDFGDYKTMVTAHTVDVGSGRAGIRWYEMRDQGSGWFLHQEGTFGPDDGENRWMPSAAMNAAGDIGIGYMVSSTNTYVSTAVAGQTAASSGLGVLDTGETICAAGSGVQTETARAGDYSATSVDPLTDSFWHTNEVFTQSGQFQWNTFVCEFTVGDGNAPPTASFTYNCTDLACSFDGSGSSDDDGTISAYDWDFGDGNVGSGESVSNSYDEDGSYDVTLVVTDDGGASDSQTQTITVDDGVNDPPTASFTYSCTELSCDFTDTSTDSDGTVDQWSWDFGDETGTSTAQNPSYTYAAGGTYTVTLTATDDGGESDSTSQGVTVAETPNEAPVASFTFSCSDLSCDFDGSGSSDSDGSITDYDWTFGDTSTGSGITTSHSYSEGGDYTVTLTVTDDDGATGDTSQTVSVSEASGITLSATGYKVRGVHHADLSWEGVGSTNVDVYRDGALITTTANEGFYTDNIGERGPGTYEYQVCEAGTSTCSNTATVVF